MSNSIDLHVITCDMNGYLQAMTPRMKVYITHV